MVKIVFTIHGDLPEAGLKHSEIFDGSALTLSTIQKLFPFDGTFHFRQRYDNMWMDITDPHEDLLTSPIFVVNSTLEIQALLLHLENVSDEDESYSRYLNDMERELSQKGLLEDGRQNRVIVGSSPGAQQTSQQRASKEKSRASSSKEHSKHSESPDSISLESAAKAATSIWNSVRTTASHIQKNITQVASSRLSDVSEENLSELNDDLYTVFSDHSPKDMCALSDLWNGLFPGTSFQRNSAKWKEVGFQNTDPTQDLKASGILALRAMAYLCERYGDRAQRMMSTNKTNTSLNYPFAVVGINITLMLADVLGIKEQRYLSMQSNYWELFENKQAFFELFCVCFCYLDKIWTTRRATRSDFGKLMTEVKAATTATLSRSPKTIPDLRNAAAQTGMC